MRYILFLCVLLCTTFSFAQKKKTAIPFIRPLPVPHHTVNDFAHFLTVEQNGSLEKELSGYRARTGNALVFISLDSLTDARTQKQYTIEEAANLYFNKWGIGDSLKNNGVLLIMSRSPRRVRIEVGKGLEPVLTNDICQQIIDDKLVPNFKKGTFYQGIKEAVAAIEQNLDNPPVAAAEPDIPNYSYQEETASTQTEESSAGGVFGMAAAVFVSLIVLIIIWVQRQAGRVGGLFSGTGFRRAGIDNSFAEPSFTDNSSDSSSWSSNDNSVAAFSSPSFDSSPSPSSDSFSGGSSDGGGASGSW